MKIEIIKSGRNNFVGKFFINKKPYIKKKYSKTFTTRHDRHKTETYFINLLKENNISELPKIISTNYINKENIIEHIKGNKINSPSYSELLQCINFIKKINSKKIKSKILKFQLAADGCLSIMSHINNIENRLRKLDGRKETTEISRKAKIFLKSVVVKDFNKRKKDIFKKVKKNLLTRKLKNHETIVSPSDFGFHNTIRRNNKLYFIDFEYAGFDDPVKLLCDFICNPDFKINNEKENFFINN